MLASNLEGGQLPPIANLDQDEPIQMLGIFQPIALQPNAQDSGSETGFPEILLANQELEWAKKEADRLVQK